MPMNERVYANVSAELFQLYGRRTLTAKEVGEYTGIDRRTAAKVYSISRNGINIHALAAKIAKQ